MKKRRPFFWVSVTLVSVLLLIGGVIAWLTHRTDSLTATQPAPIPVTQPSPDQLFDIQRRVEAFSVAAESGQSAEVVLTAADLNTLVASRPELAGKAYVQLEGNRVNVQTALPLDAVPGGAGRYFNGTVSLDVAIENGTLSITPTAIATDSQPIPKEIESGILQALSAPSLNQRINSDPRVQAWLKNVTTIQVQDGNLVIKR